MCLWTRYKEQIAHEDIMCYKFVLVNKITGKWCGRFQYSQKEFDFDMLLKNNEKPRYSSIIYSERNIQNSKK